MHTINIVSSGWTGSKNKNGTSAHINPCNTTNTLCHASRASIEIKCCPSIFQLITVNIISAVTALAQSHAVPRAGPDREYTTPTSSSEVSHIPTALR
jgi:hypothetical protein